MSNETILLLEILVSVVNALIWGFATAAVRDRKGYGRNWFWLGFFFGVPPFVVACAIPAKEYYGPGELPDLPKTYQEPEMSLFLEKEQVEKTLAAGGWQCACGRANMPNVSTCTCGLSKRGQGSNAAVERRQKVEEARKEAEAELKKLKVMYEAELISREEYEEQVALLRRKTQVF